MARVIDTSGLPSVMPDVRPPQDYQNINPSADSFGALPAAAQQRAGAQMEQGSNELASAAIEKQGIYNNTAANQLFTKFQNTVNNLMSGDPSKPGDLGYFGLTGQAAMEQRKPFRDQMESAIAQGMANAPNDVVRNRFQEISRRLQSITYEQMGQHYEREMKTWGISTAMGAITETQRGIANNYNNDEYFKHSLADSDTMSAEQAKTSGVNPATLIAENQSKAVESRIKGAIAQNDYAWAQNIFQQYGDKLDPNTRAALETHLKGKADAAAGQQMFSQWQTGSAPGDGSAPRSAGPLPAIPSDLEQIGKAAAAKYGVPWDVFAHQIAGESGWNPNIHPSSAGAEGIAQFIPGTAAQYGVDVKNPQSSLEGAAKYMADLHQQGGSWEHALSGYLSGHPGPEIKSVTSTNPEYASAYAAARAHDRGAPQNLLPGAPASSEVAQEASQPDIAVGDSIAAGAIRHAGVGGSEADFKTGANAPGSARVGAPTSEVLRRINNMVATDPESFRGKNVLLSTGASNSPNDLAPVADQLNALKAAGANVTMLGVGPKFPGVNDKLQTMATQAGVNFTPLANVGSDGVHPTDYRAVVQAASSPPSTDSVIGGGQPPAGGTLVTAGAQPAPGATPAPVQAPGVADLSRMQSELAQQHARITIAATSDPRRFTNPEAWKQGVEQAELEFKLKNQAINEQKQALINMRDDTFRGLVQKIETNPNDPGLVNEINNPNQLDGQMIENLNKLHDEKIKGTLQGDVMTLGSGYRDINRLIVDPATPPDQRINDASQILLKAEEVGSDGRKLLTATGVKQLLDNFKESRSDIVKAREHELVNQTFQDSITHFATGRHTSADKINQPMITEADKPYVQQFDMAFTEHLAAGQRAGLPLSKILAPDEIKKLWEPIDQQRSAAQKALDMSAAAAAQVAAQKKIEDANRARHGPSAPGVPAAGGMNPIDWLIQHKDLWGPAPPPPPTPSAPMQ